MSQRAIWGKADVAPPAEMKVCFWVAARRLRMSAIGAKQTPRNNWISRANEALLFVRIAAGLSGCCPDRQDRRGFGWWEQ